MLDRACASQRAAYGWTERGQPRALERRERTPLFDLPLVPPPERNDRSAGRGTCRRMYALARTHIPPWTARQVNISCGRWWRTEPRRAVSFPSGDSSRRSVQPLHLDRVDCERIGMRSRKLRSRVRYARYGETDAHYDSVGAAVLWTRNAWVRRGRRPRPRQGPSFTGCWQERCAAPPGKRPR